MMLSTNQLTEKRVHQGTQIFNAFVKGLKGLQESEQLIITPINISTVTPIEEVHSLMRKDMIKVQKPPNATKLSLKMHTFYDKADKRYCDFDTKKSANEVSFKKVVIMIADSRAKIMEQKRNLVTENT